MNLNELLEPFEVNKIRWRVGSTTKDKKRGLALAYVDARDVMERLDEVCGAHNWQCRYPFGESGRVCCEIGIKVDDWIWKSDGAGATDYEADKGGFSDAFKRAAVRWGVARYLYGLPNEWVDLDANQKIVTPPTLPDWAKPKPVALECVLGEIKDCANLDSLKEVYETHIDNFKGQDRTDLIKAKDIRKQELA